MVLPQGPPQLTGEALAVARADAIQAFVQERAAEGGQRYHEAFVASSMAVERLFAVTDDLTRSDLELALAERC